MLGGQCLSGDLHKHFPTVLVLTLSRLVGSFWPSSKCWWSSSVTETRTFTRTYACLGHDDSSWWYVFCLALYLFTQNITIMCIFCSFERAMCFRFDVNICCAEKFPFYQCRILTTIRFNIISKRVTSLYP